MLAPSTILLTLSVSLLPSIASAGTIKLCQFKDKRASCYIQEQVSDDGTCFALSAISKWKNLTTIDPSPGMECRFYWDNGKDGKPCAKPASKCYHGTTKNKWVDPKDDQYDYKAGGPSDAQCKNSMIEFFPTHFQCWKL